MAEQETYYYGNGKVKLATIAADGSVGPWRWAYDVSALSVALAVDKVEHKESYSGQKALVRSFPVGKTATLNATLHSLNADNLALTLFGTPTSTAAGSVTGEALPEVVAGDVVSLAHPGVSNLAITDSAGTPATLDPANYSVDAWGNVTFSDLPSTPALTQPFKAAYSHAATEEVSIFSAPQPTVALRYEGVNLAEGGAPVLVELYKIATDPLKELALISSGTEVAGMQITGGVLLDSSKPANGSLGQFGRIVQVKP